MNAITKLLIIACAMGGITAGGYHHQMNEVNNNNQQAQSYKISANKYKNETHAYTINKVHKQFDKTEPNLSQKLNNNKKNITQGMNIALSNCQTTSKFNRNKPKINNLLGNSVGNKMQQVIKPQSTLSFKVPRSTSNKMTQCFVSYGEYNSVTHSIKVSVTATYDTPPTDFEAGMGSKHTPHYVVRKGVVAITATLNVSNNNLTLNNENDQIINEND